MSETLFQELMEGEGILVLERQTAETFLVIGTPPPWAALLPQGQPRSGEQIRPAEVFAFLEHFLREVAVVWETGAGGGVTSEPWMESLATREEIAFTATAKRVGSRNLLLIRGLGLDFDERYRVLRKAREMALAHERLLKETSEKEALLHCLVHDVSGPLKTVANCFQVLQAEGVVREEGREVVRLGASASHRQQVVLAEMLGLFAAEVNALDAYSADPATAPEVLDCAHSVLRALRHSFELKGVTFELLLSPASTTAWKVVGHRERLERVLFNLLNNALRQAPTGSMVTLRLEDEGPAIRVSVVDHGTGAAPEPGPRVNRPALSGDRDETRVNLSLFFCRAMIEHWSGEIGRCLDPGGGNCFWFRLSKPPGLGARGSVVTSG